MRTTRASVKSWVKAICCGLAGLLLIGGGRAAAQTNTAYGSGALPSPSSGFLCDSAFGLNAQVLPLRARTIPRWALKR
jgi:hypothetical protein